MIVVVVSTIMVVMVSTVVVVMIRITSASMVSMASPLYRENTPGGGEQDDDANKTKDKFHVPKVSTF
jgi:hypothetical protein